MSQFFAMSGEQHRILNEYVSHPRNSGTEFEIRFGNFVYHRETKQSTFVSSVETDFFYRLKHSFEGQGFPKEEIQTTEKLYTSNSGKGIIKKIVHHNTNNNTNNTTFLTKNSFKKYNVFDYNLRLSLANEKYITEEQFERQIGELQITREKQRTRFVLSIGYLDLTRVICNGEIQFEVELEITSGDISAIYQFLTVILQTRQENFLVISNFEQRNILQEYKNLVKTHHFIGAQPETLQKSDLQNLYKTSYSVTDKADGERMLLYISGTNSNNSNSNKTVYFLDSNISKVLKTNVTVDNKMKGNTLIDGELVKINNQLHFLAFDLIFYEGTDLRGNTDYLLVRRLELLKTIVSQLDGGDLYAISTKQFIHKNVFLGSEVILNSIDEKLYKNDGLIFTPTNEPYPTTKKWAHLLKWKPAELNTIDFYSIRKADGVWELYVQHKEQLPQQRSSDKKGQQVNSTEKVLFDVEKLCKTPEPLGYMTFQTTFSESLIDPTTGIPFESGTVIEYSWDVVAQKFVPLRTRWDKTQNPKKHGNFSSVACDIWNNIHNPVEKELLFRFTTFSTSKEDLFFERMRRYHNKVKEYLYNKYTKNSKHLLELCSGKGGDLHKWIHNNIGEVVGYDISEKNITECKRRINSMKGLVQQFNFYQYDLCQSDAAQEILSHNSTPFDNICCHFGVHYFFKSEESFRSLVKILDASLINGGSFIVTFMDNTALKQLMKSQKVFFRERDDQIVYYIKQTETNSIFGNELRIVLNGNGSNILTEGSNEYIIDYNNFVQTMKEHGYHLRETELFSNFNDASFKNLLTPEEREISFLNRYCVFQKGNQTHNQIQQCHHDIQIPSNISHVTNQKQFPTFSLIDLHQKNLSAYKITSLYDIIDIVNCIEYKYYKHVIPNHEIVTFSDIEHVFQIANINLTPFYVSTLDTWSNSHNVIHFTYHKHTIEKKTPDGTIDNIYYDNWYILLHKDNILFTQQDVQNSQQQPQKQEQGQQKREQGKQQQPQKQEDTTILQNITNPKVTLKQLKEIAAQLGLKVSGKKEELYQRIFENISK